MSRSLAFLKAFITLVPSGILGQSNIDSNTFRLFYLGGQSNMDGYGYNSELPDALNKTFENAWIFHGNIAKDGDSETGGLGQWQPLQPGHGTGFSSDGTTNHYSERFGIELAFAHQLQKLYPNDNIAITQEKYARTDPQAAIIRTTRYYKYSDPWHYDSEGYIDLGKQFAEAVYQLSSPN